MKNQGFTLIELIVVVAAMGMIMITVTTITVNSFRARNRMSSLTELEQNGDILINSLKNNVFNSTKIDIGCQLNPLNPGTTLKVTNANNGEITNLVCYQNERIASESAKSNILLTNSDYVPDCFNFARCETMPDNGHVSKINFSFSLTKFSGGEKDISEAGVSKNFNSSVTVRN